MKNKILIISLTIMLLVVIFVGAAGCSIKCNQSYTLEVVNDSGNSLPIHASIDGEVGSAAPRIEPGGSHTFTFDLLEDGTEESHASANLIISRNEEILGQEPVTFSNMDMKTTVFDAVTGGVAFETEHN